LPTKNEDLDISRLCQAIQQSRLALVYPRQVRVDMTKQYVGRYYSIEGPVKPVPVNMVALYVNIVGQKLISANPRVMLGTWDQGNRPVVSTMERWVNKQIDKLRLVNTFSRVITDALFAFGVVKVGLASPGEAAASNWRQGAAKPFAHRVDLDDFVFDVHARDFGEVQFMGHRVRWPLRVVRDSKLFSKDRKSLGPMPDKLYNMEGDERIGTLGRTTMAGDHEFEDCVDLWEIYLPRHRLVVTLQDDHMSGAGGTASGKALRIQRWLGPDSGPYHILGFGVVPGNSRPKAPLHDLFDLHLSINNIVRKLMRQAQRCKSILAVGGGKTEDGDKIEELNDGDVGNISSIDNIKEQIYGTPNPQLFQLFNAFKELFSWLAGNLEIMGGLSPQSKTASQDQLMQQNSSATISVMQSRVLDHVSDVISAMCWYWHHDPTKVMRSDFQIPGSRMTIPTYAAPQFRHAIPFEDLDISIDPYSLPHQTPQSRLAAINQIVQGTFIPLAQLAQQQGIGLDLNQYFNLAAKYMDQPDLPTILTTAQPPAQDSTGPGPGGGANDMPTKPQNTTRTYERRSLGGDTTAGRNQQIANAMSEAASQNGNGKQ
jgi:hypothetical protein